MVDPDEHNVGVNTISAERLWRRIHRRCANARGLWRYNPAMAPRPTCSCGHDRYHHYARASLTYGGGGWFALLNGASGTPRQIVFRCGKCGETFETTREKTILKQFRRYPYVNKPED